MESLLIHVDLDTGEQVYVRTKDVHPFGVAELRLLKVDRSSALDLAFTGVRQYDDSRHSREQRTFRTSVTFHKTPLIYTLVPGGWLPPAFALPSRFLVDSNFIITLERLNSGKNVKDADAFLWWTDFVSSHKAEFNPLPYAFELGLRNTLSEAAFISAFDEGATILREGLPNCTITRFRAINYTKAYEQLTAFNRRHTRELRFLLSACPLVAQRVANGRTDKLANELLNLADKHDVARSSLVTLCVLSCLFEDVHGLVRAIGKGILNPKAPYSEKAAYNALSDLRHIELAAVTHASLPLKDTFHLCTSDWALAALWSAVRFRGNPVAQGVVPLMFSVTSELLSRLSDSDVLEFTQRLRN